MLMHQEFKKAWVAALRSGEYKQGVGRLYINGCYCCLGVGAYVLKKQFPEILDGVCSVGFDGDYMRIWSPGTDDDHTTFWPDILRQKLGVSDDELGNLTKMNDIWGWRFPKIADYIEEEL